MVRSHVICGWIVALLLLPGTAAAMRCGGRVVDTGDYAVQVRKRCGEPYWISETSTILVYGAYGPVVQRAVQEVQDWYYNFGSSRLVRRLVFVDGRLHRIDTLGYGRARIGTDCNDIAFLRGTREGELVLRCGAPSERYTRFGDTTWFDRYGYGVIQPLRYEEWHYPGNRGHIRLVIMVDGRIDRSEWLDLD
ncbi:MAG: hypothetical protein CVV14_12090 [Gammaproteobacteria bacterium HGW-Gammaproteobacteria-4]|jgi:hypothetical protein|nr:MAG: hypothetical protein CVV14_12090 [Gammaproteobacteria bacterium HGW-Gammaproteobacteria-4]